MKLTDRIIHYMLFPNKPQLQPILRVSSRLTIEKIHLYGRCIGHGLKDRDHSSYGLTAYRDGIVEYCPNNLIMLYSTRESIASMLEEYCTLLGEKVPNARRDWIKTKYYRIKPISRFTLHNVQDFVTFMHAYAEDIAYTKDKQKGVTTWIA